MSCRMASISCRIASNTARNCRTEANSLQAYFGPAKRLRDVTAGDVDEFVVWLKEQGLAAATIGRRLKRCKQFFRAADARRLAPDGSGVGLYAARGLIEAMGGGIAIESHLGAGTTVTT